MHDHPGRIISLGLLGKYREETPGGAHLSSALGAVLSRFAYTSSRNGGRWIVLDDRDHPQACEDLGFLDFCGLEAVA